MRRDTRARATSSETSEGGELAVLTNAMRGTFKPTGARYERTPSGTISNCSVANGAPEKGCQICGGACPDRLFELEREQPLSDEQRASMKEAIRAGWRPPTEPSESRLSEGLGPGDEIEVAYGQATFTPVKFCTFTVGPFSARTTIRDGETAEDARRRVLPFLKRTADEAFREQLATFLTRVEEAAREADRAAVKGRGR